MKTWGRIIVNNKYVKDSVAIIDDSNLSRTKKIFAALTQICLDLDLSEPIWLDSNISEFKRNSKTRFYKDSFIEQIEFDYLEFQIVEE